MPFYLKVIELPGCNEFVVKNIVIVSNCTTFGQCFSIFQFVFSFKKRKRADDLMTERVRLETYLMQVTILGILTISTSLCSEIGLTTIYRAIHNMLVKFSMLLQETLAVISIKCLFLMVIFPFRPTSLLSWWTNNLKKILLSKLVEVSMFTAINQNNNKCDFAM